MNMKEGVEQAQLNFVAGQLENFKKDVKIWLSEEYPDIHKNLSLKADEIVAQQKSLKALHDGYRNEIEKIFRTCFEDIKREVNEFITEKHPIFKTVERAALELASTQRAYNEQISNNNRALESITMAEQKAASFMKSNSFFEEFFKMKDELKEIKKSFESFKTGLKRMFESPAPINPSQKMNEFDVSVRLMNVLESAHIETVEEFMKISDADFLRFRNVGKSTLKEVYELRKRIGPLNDLQC